MKFAIIALALTIAMPAAAAPKAGRVERAFGNTVVSTYPDGRTGLLWLKADGTYTAKGRRRTPSSGTWSVKGEKMCLKQVKPMKAPFSYCTRLPSGTSWSAKAVTGEPIKVTIVPGIKAS
jgi:hypothetical protein